MTTATVKSFFDKQSFTITHIVSAGAGTPCAIIDPVLGFDQVSGRTNTTEADQIIQYVQDQNLTVDYILETHVHADHLTASPYLKEKLGGKIGIGSGIKKVQDGFQNTFNTEKGFYADGRQFDCLFDDNEVLNIGDLKFDIWHTAGHTPACVTYVVQGDTAFVGDTLFMPDFGTARCDFPGGDAATLYTSIKRILSLPNETRLFMCHDYGPNGRDIMWETTVKEQRQNNIHINDTVSEADFIEQRETRDATLSMPKLILPSIQVNMRAGHFPPAEDNGISYLKIPLDVV